LSLYLSFKKNTDTYFITQVAFCVSSKIIYEYYAADAKCDLCDHMNVYERNINTSNNKKQNNNVMTDDMYKTISNRI